MAGGPGDLTIPARSEAQRRYLYSRFGAAWVRKHHFDTKGPLPARVGKKKKAKKRRKAVAKKKARSKGKPYLRKGKMKSVKGGYPKGRGKRGC